MLGQILIAIVTMIVGTRVLGIDTTIWIPIADINLDIGVGYYFPCSSCSSARAMPSI